MWYHKNTEKVRIFSALKNTKSEQKRRMTMSKKMPPLSVLKELAGEGVELNDDVLDAVAGGAYTEEEWFAMSEEERKAAQQRSIVAKTLLKIECELD